MMSITLRIILVVGSVLAFLFILRKIRKCQLEISDSIFWFIFTAVLIVVAIFPQLIIYPAAWIGFDSPANMLFLIIIFVMLVKQFMMTLQVGSLKSKLKTLTQAEALEAHKAAIQEQNKDGE